MCLVSTDEDSSTLDMTFAWRGLVLMTEEVCPFMKFSRNSTCSVIRLCVTRLGIGQHLCQDPNKRDTKSCHRVMTSLGQHVLMLKTRTRLYL